MKKYAFKMICIMLSVFILAGMLAACTGKQPASTETAKASNETTNAQTTVAQESVPVYPMDTDVTLTYWCRLNTSKTGTNFSEAPFAKELEKRTGVKIEYIHPPIGGDQEKDAFNIMVASGDLPDIIEYPQWQLYAGGPGKVLSDGIAIELNEVIGKYTPNLKKLLSDNTTYDKAVKTDGGQYWCFPFIRGDLCLQVYQGPFLRKDWLDDLGLQVPATIDEWYAVLKDFKEKKNADAPFTIGKDGSMQNGLFIGAYGILGDFYIGDDGLAKYGPAEPAYKEYLMLLKKWFDEGILDKNFATLDKKTQIANMLNGKSGATHGNLGGHMGTILSTAKTQADVDPKYDLVGAPYPVLNKGEKPKFGQMEAPFPWICSAVITTKCKNVEIAARFLDYNYGEEGYMLNNFGIEGESYTMVKDYPTYTDLIMKNPDGLSLVDSMALYIRAMSGGPFVQDKRYMEQYTSLPSQIDALGKWVNTDAAIYRMPMVTFTSDESSEVTKLLSDIKTYKEEKYLQFIMGVEPIEKFDAYIAQLKAMGIGRLLDIYTAALQRYNKR